MPPQNPKRNLPRQIEYKFRNRVGITNIAHRMLLIISALLLPFLITVAPKIDPNAAPRVGVDPISELYRSFLNTSSSLIPNCTCNVFDT